MPTLKEKRRFMVNKLFSVACAAVLLTNVSQANYAAESPNGKTITAAAVKKSAPTPDSVVMQAMEKELVRSFAKLKNAGPTPVHYLAYRLYDEQTLSLSYSYGGAEENPEMAHWRVLNVELRAGSPQLDSTHRSLL